MAKECRNCSHGAVCRYERHWARLLEEIINYNPHNTTPRQVAEAIREVGAVVAKHCGMYTESEEAK